ncbi:Uncharacterized protein TCM_045124 [Theobroma cacao]|uniref:Uncharacterized protein n=1 Tax=Theobroma cacao TaxID=3641 RepID=A0A061FRT7_THECC|nr:Uncharacterized protein TCM_045124 [Theobroma cacao]
MQFHFLHSSHSASSVVSGRLSKLKRQNANHLVFSSTSKYLRKNKTRGNDDDFDDLLESKDLDSNHHFQLRTNLPVRVKGSSLVSSRGIVEKRSKSADKDLPGVGVSAWW